MSEEKPKAEEAEAPAAEGKPAKAPMDAGKKKLIMIAAILILDLAIMGGAAFFIVNKLKDKHEDVAAEEKKKQEEEEKKAHEALTKIGKTLPKPLPFTVNIPGSNPQETHYLKCSIQLEWEAAEGKEAKAEGGEGGEGAAAGPTDPLGKAIVERMPKITDIIINILSSQGYSELLKASGKQKIKESIVSEVNAILPTEEGRLKNAFFTEFIVQ